MAFMAVIKLYSHLSARGHLRLHFHLFLPLFLHGWAGTGAILNEYIVYITHGRYQSTTPGSKNSLNTGGRAAAVPACPLFMPAPGRCQY